MKANEYVAQFGAAKLKEVIATSRSNLAKPNVRWPNGRMSHDVESEILEAAHDRLLDLRIGGQFVVDGNGMRFHSYADGTPA